MEICETYNSCGVDLFTLAKLLLTLPFCVEGRNEHFPPPPDLFSRLYYLCCYWKESYFVTFYVTLADFMNGWLAGWLHAWFASGLIGCLADWLNDRLPEWLNLSYRKKKNSIQIKPKYPHILNLITFKM